MKNKQRHTYTLLRQNLLDKHNVQKLLACAVSKKYKKLRECLPSNFTKYVSNVTRAITKGKISLNDVEVEHLVKSCMHFRQMHYKRFTSAFKKLKLLALAAFSKLLDTCDDPHEVILGPSMHTASSESFFPTTIYHDVAYKDGNVDVSFLLLILRKNQKMDMCPWFM